MVCYNYFAYGSNMNFEQMKERCPSARFLRQATLRDYKFVYDGYSFVRKGAVANVKKCKKAIVLGALFAIDGECIKSLDICENCPRNYQRKVLEVKDNMGRKHQAYIYLRDAQKEERPSDEYQKIILNGARECDLPRNYINNYLKGKTL